MNGSMNFNTILEATTIIRVQTVSLLTPKHTLVLSFSKHPLSPAPGSHFENVTYIDSYSLAPFRDWLLLISVMPL
jgi:hypothetical protein